jgi:beta-mannosidase
MSLRQTFPLNEGWSFQSPDRSWKKAVVPGCVHSDLLRLRLIPDPHFGENEKKITWVDARDWSYRKTFDKPAAAKKAQRCVLIFEGLDTIAEITLNGKRLGLADNMFRTWRFDVTRLLHDCGNQLLIRFRSPTRAALAEEKKHGIYVQANGDSARQHLRKAACSYGWDWGIRLPTSGLWRGVHLECVFSKDLIADAVLDTIAFRSGKTPRVEFRASVDSKNLKGLQWVLSGRCGSHRWTRKIPVRARETKALFEVRGAKLWMVRGYGAPHLYDIRIDLMRNSDLLDRREFRFGFRTIEVEQERDAAGKSFRWVVNGVPIWIRGSNWIPVDSMIPRDHDHRTRELVDLACDANMNMLRVWGGGVYESDLFFDLCDEKGMLVWQDFMFACGLYPEHKAYAQSVELEAEDNIRRLRHHPSLSIWCGNNENDWAYEAGWTGFRDRGRLMGGLYYHKLLPDLCQRLDPHRFYWPSSPFGSIKPNGHQDGDVHSWDVVHGKPDFTICRLCRGRFISEFGTQGMPALQTIKEALPRNQWHPLSAGAEHHQRHKAGQSWLVRQIQEHFRVSGDLEEFTQLSQVFQGEAVKYCIEFWRSLKWHCSGALYWQLNDVWPAISWSSIDSELRPKALHFYAKRFFAPVLATFQDEEDGIHVIILNDTLKSLKAVIELQALTFEGRMTKRVRIPIQVAANGKLEAVNLRRGDWLRADGRHELISMRLLSGRKEIARNIYFFVRHRNLLLPEPRLAVRRLKGGLEVSTNVFAKGVWLHSRGREIPIDDNYFDLLPGEKRLLRARPGFKLPAGTIEAQALA